MAFVESGRGMPDHPGSPLSFPKEGARARRPTIHHRAYLPTVQSLAPREEDEPPFGLPPSPYPRHRVVFEKLVQVLVFGCAYEKIADGSCSATTLRDRSSRRVDRAWGVIERLREMTLEAYDRAIGLDLSELAVDCCITKAPCGGEKAGKSPVDRGKRGLSSVRWSLMGEASP